MGYGYGIWFAIKNMSHICHIPHITLMCNMTLNEACKLYNILRYTKYNKCVAKRIGSVVQFPSSYANDDKGLIAHGYYVSIDEWDELSSKVNDNFIGSISHKPHITTLYRERDSPQPQTPKDNTTDNKEFSFECNIVLADIRSRNPTEWKILKK